MNGIQQTINGLGETTALFGVQGADKFVETWTGVGKGLEVIAEHPVDTLFINPAMDAYENYSQIYEKGGAGAVVGAVVGDVLSAVPTILSGGALRQIKNIGKHHTEGPGPKPGPKPEPKVYNTEEEFDIIHDVKQTSKAGVDGVATNSSRFDNALFSSDIRQTQPASQELIDAVSSRREVYVAMPGSEDLKFLEMTGSDASAGGPGNLSIIIKEKPQRLTLVEEFLHGTQSKMWGDPPLEVDNRVRNFREWHVRDFMNRHQKMFGWDADEQSVLKTELQHYRNLVEKQK